MVELRGPIITVQFIHCVAILKFEMYLNPDVSKIIIPRNSLLNESDYESESNSLEV